MVAFLEKNRKETVGSSLNDTVRSVDVQTKGHSAQSGLWRWAVLPVLDLMVCSNQNDSIIRCYPLRFLQKTPWAQSPCGVLSHVRDLRAPGELGCCSEERNLKVSYICLGAYCLLWYIGWQKKRIFRVRL